MKKLMWFVLGFALVFVAGGAFLLGCLPNPQASDATPPPGISTPEATPVTTPTTAPALASLAWRRDGPTECSGLRVDDLSQLHLAPCEGDSALMRFSQQELHTYLAYVARYAPFTYHEDPSPESEMAAIDLTFVGRGTREATPEEQAEMSAWAAAVHERIRAEAQRTEMIATARSLLASMLNIVPDVITTVAVEQVTWPDACLGLPQPGVACAQVETPGYRIILRVGTSEYTYRTDLRGLVRLATQEPTATPSPTPTTPATPTNTPPPPAVPTATPSPTPTTSPTPTPVPTWTPAPAPTDHWRAEYWANDRLEGNPAVVAREDSVARTWGYGGPSGVPSDHFSARWTRRVYFEDGKYDFRLEADDGVRLWVGGMLVIDRWSGGHRVDMVSQKHIPQGEHVVVVEYFELEGYAKIELGWHKVYIPPTPAPEPVITDWRGEYYNNVALEGPPALITNETQIQFEWGEGSPHPAIQRDGFSARFTRRLQFARGDYRLTAVADDGVRVWIDGRVVIDAWQPGIRRAFTHVVTLDGAHDLRVDYFEQGGAAALGLGWELISPPVPTATATVAPPTSTPTQTPVPPTPTPSPTPTQVPANIWIGEYYSNTDLIGTPLVTREEQAVAFEWGEGSPHPSLPNDRFSARFSQRVTLSPGIYRLGLVVDDGARLYVDGQLVIDEWRATVRRHVVADMPLGGEHVIRIEYFENGGAAALYYGLEFLRPTDGTPSPVTPVPTATPTPAAEWVAEYYDNTELRGEPEFTRREEELSFDWREEEPDRRLGKDEFSARYTRTMEFPRGTYRLHLVVDDGARVYVDGTLVIDQWRSGIRRHVVHDLALEGTHTIVVEYYENKGGAALFFAWEAVGGAALGEGEASENLLTTLDAARAVRGIRPPNRRNR